MTRRLSRGKGGCGVTAVAKLHVAQLLGRSASAVGQRSVGCGCSGVLTERPVNLPVLADLTLPTACQPALQRLSEATGNFATADSRSRKWLALCPCGLARFLRGLADALEAALPALL